MFCVINITFKTMLFNPSLLSFPVCRELWGIPAIAVRHFVCVCLSRGGEGLAGTTVHSNHKFRQHCSSWAFTCQPPAVGAFQPVTGSWGTLTAGASSHQQLADGLLLLTAPCQGTGLSRDGWNRLYYICFFPENVSCSHKWAGLLSGVAGGCPLPVFLVSDVEFVSGCC